GNSGQAKKGLTMAASTTTTKIVTVSGKWEDQYSSTSGLLSITKQGNKKLTTELYIVTGEGETRSITNCQNQREYTLTISETHQCTDCSCPDQTHRKGPEGKQCKHIQGFNSALLEEIRKECFPWFHVIVHKTDRDSLPEGFKKVFYVSKTSQPGVVALFHAPRENKYIDDFQKGESRITYAPVEQVKRWFILLGKVHKTK